MALFYFPRLFTRGGWVVKKGQNSVYVNIEWSLIVVSLDCTYRTRANNGRSRLVAAPLSSQAKMHFLLAFYVTI